MDWDSVRLHLPEDIDFEAIDLPGYGNSPSPVKPLSESLHDLEEMLLERSMGRKFILAGYSLGGRLAVELAFRDRLPIHCLLLMGARPGYACREEAARRLAADEQAASEVIADMAGFIDRWYRQPLFGDLADSPLYPALRAKRGANDPEALAASLVQWSAGRQADRSEFLKTALFRLQLLVGEQDPVYVPLYRRLCLPCTSLFGAAHAVLVQAPHEVARHLMWNATRWVK